MNGWDKHPNYGSTGGWGQTIIALVAVILLGLGLIYWASVANAQSSADIVGRASITDGDTIRIGDLRIRLNGYDTPEAGSSCAGVNVYQRASHELRDLIADREVSCRVVGDGAHNRVAARCTVGGVDFGEYMVSQGWGRDWPRYSGGDYQDEEQAARRTRRGLWGLECSADLWRGRDYSNPAHR